MNEPPIGLMEVATEFARAAGQAALRHFRTPLSIEHKADGSPVTIADRAAEQAAREGIEARFPEDGILGEELGSTRPGARRQWLVDPIDGTQTFVRGVPLWGSLVAVIEADRVLAGAACFPALGEMIAAAAGGGCFWNGAASRVSEISTLEKATALTTDERFGADPSRRAAWTRLAARAALSRSWGDCYGYLLVATGRAEAMVDPKLSAWDSAPVLVIVEEAGGVFTDWSGQRTAAGGSAIATNAGVAREARLLLCGTGEIQAAAARHARS